MTLRPFFSYYGSKWRLAPLYPAPRNDVVVEPFAGSAGYSLRYHQKRVMLYDLSPVICGIWDFLIRASESEIMRLPMLEPEQEIRALEIPQEAAWLIGFWAHQGSTHPGRKASKWGARPSHGWRPAIRERIARQLAFIRHWRVECRGYETLEDRGATWFVDPPYNNPAGQKYYSSSWARPIDFDHLAQFCKTRSGQVIVCENTGATWLPFSHLKTAHASTKRDGRTRSAEAVWLSGEPDQTSMRLT